MPLCRLANRPVSNEGVAMKRDQAAIDLAEAVAEYFNISLRTWRPADREAAGRYVFKQAALRMGSK
jgi:hypothetical protein